MDKIRLISFDGNSDERADNVHLVESYEDEKTTAEDCGDHWQIRDWELGADTMGKFWFDRSAYSISKTLVLTLMMLPNSPEQS